VGVVDKLGKSFFLLELSLENYFIALARKLDSGALHIAKLQRTVKCGKGSNAAVA
jgi:hypothetical protein